MGLSYRTLNESERMQGIVEEHVSRKAKQQGAFNAWALPATLLSDIPLRKLIPNPKTRYAVDIGLGLLGAAGASALQGKITDHKIKRLMDPNAKHLRLDKTASVTKGSLFYRAISGRGAPVVELPRGVSMALDKFLAKLAEMEKDGEFIRPLGRFLLKVKPEQKAKMVGERHMLANAIQYLRSGDPVKVERGASIATGLINKLSGAAAGTEKKKLDLAKVFYPNLPWPKKPL